MASLRVASAVAAAPPPVNLMPHAAGRYVGRTGRIAAVLGVAAAVALAAFLYEAWTAPVDVAPQSTVVNRQSSIDSRRSTIGSQQPTVVNQQSSVDTHQSTVDSHQTSVVRRQSSTVVNQQSTVDSHQSSVPGRPPSRDALRRASRATPADRRSP